MAMDYSGIAGELASRGRYGDSMLMHVNPMEVEGLASIVPITRNPDTGLPEAFWPLLIGAALGGLAGGLNAKSNDTPLLQGILGGAVLGGLGGSGIGAMAGAGAAGGAGAGAAALEGAAGGASAMAPGATGVLAPGATAAQAGGAALTGPVPVAAELGLGAIPEGILAGAPEAAMTQAPGAVGAMGTAPGAVGAAGTGVPVPPGSGVLLPGAEAVQPGGAVLQGPPSAGSMLGESVAAPFEQGFAVQPEGGIMSNVTGAQNKIGNFVVDNPGTTLMGLAALDAIMPKQELEEDFGESSFEGDPTWSDREQQPRSYAGTSPGGRQRSYFGRV